MYIVKSPVKGYSGISAGVQFKDGVGQTDNQRAADWLREKGYEVVEETALYAAGKPSEPQAPPKPPKSPEQSTDAEKAKAPEGTDGTKKNSKKGGKS